MSTRDNVLGALAQCAAALEQWHELARNDYEVAEKGPRSSGAALEAANNLLRAPWAYALAYDPGQTPGKQSAPYVIKRVSDDKRTIEAYGGRLLRWQPYPNAHSIPKRYTSRGIALRAMQRLILNGGMPK